MLNFLKKIFIGTQPSGGEKMENAYKQQLGYLKQIWKEGGYGLERIFRLSLCLVQFIYPTLLIRSLLGNLGATARKLAVEFYIILKLLFPLAVLASGLYRYNFIIVIIVYLLSETLSHILNLIFLSDIYSMPIVFRRSILFLFLHYIEVVLDFSTIYLRFDLLNKALTPVSAVYYSFVTNTTLGYGDYRPKCAAGQMVVICQLIIFIMFIVLFINYFTSKINNKD